MAVLSVTDSSSERKLPNALATSVSQYVAMPWLRHEKSSPLSDTTKISDSASVMRLRAPSGEVMSCDQIM